MSGRGLGRLGLDILEMHGVEANAGHFLKEHFARPFGHFEPVDGVLVADDQMLEGALGVVLVALIRLVEQHLFAHLGLDAHCCRVRVFRSGILLTTRARAVADPRGTHGALEVAAEQVFPRAAELFAGEAVRARHHEDAAVRSADLADRILGALGDAAAVAAAKELDAEDLLGGIGRDLEAVIAELNLDLAAGEPSQRVGQIRADVGHTEAIGLLEQGNTVGLVLHHHFGRVDEHEAVKLAILLMLGGLAVHLQECLVDERVEVDFGAIRLDERPRPVEPASAEHQHPSQFVHFV